MFDRRRRPSLPATNKRDSFSVHSAGSGNGRERKKERKRKKRGRMERRKKSLFVFLNSWDFPPPQKKGKKRRRKLNLSRLLLLLFALPWRFVRGKGSGPSWALFRLLLLLGGELGYEDGWLLLRERKRERVPLPLFIAFAPRGERQEEGTCVRQKWLSLCSQRIGGIKKIAVVSESIFKLDGEMGFECFPIELQMLLKQKCSRNSIYLYSTRHRKFKTLLKRSKEEGEICLAF